MRKQKVQAFDGVDVFHGINVYNLDGKLIDQIPYEFTFVDPIRHAVRTLLERYEVIEADDVVIATA